MYVSFFSEPLMEKRAIYEFEIYIYMRIYFKRKGSRGEKGERTQ